MASELLGTLGARRSQVERCGQTWESKPEASGADAVYLAGATFGCAPSVAEWLRQKAKEMPEEDLAQEALADALEKALGARGQTPSHSPMAPGPEEVSSLNSLAARLAEMQRELTAQRDSLGTQREELVRREAEIKEQEQALEAERKARVEREEAQRNYPMPAWLEKSCQGTMNVAVVGNSGVGKSLLINKLRRLKPGAMQWAPTGVQETTLNPTKYTFPGIDRVRLWDLPGAGTPGFPQETYIRDMGLRYFDSVLIVTAGRFTTMEVLLRGELEKHRIPYFMVRTKIDLDVWNNQLDNQIEEDVTLRNIKEELHSSHGVNQLYMVSSREPTRYDMPALMADAFPGVKEHLDHSSFLFGADAGSTPWEDSWSMPVLLSQTLAGIQGQWRDVGAGVGNVLYVIDGHEAHITLDDGQTAIVTVTEEDGKVWWCNQWYVDLGSVGKARESGELRWIPSDLQLKPLVWRWNG
eukprot:TRINITY_DN92838_c0_g1_i1.p1 TRINITY_DN92838_c0_g1~~TRINITY_DN92838_c0_g1_i1.p1  ORF type:complete len:468 (-),score=107.08 TRINITY_DN92838_c0_g1_i1:81-1484(-)